MNEKKILNLLHLARKASKVNFGFEVCKDSCRFSKAKLILLAQDLSENSRKKFAAIADSEKVKVVNISSKRELAESFKVQELGIICVEDKHFSDGIMKLV